MYAVELWFASDGIKGSLSSLSLSSTSPRSLNWSSLSGYLAHLGHPAVWPMSPVNWRLPLHTQSSTSSELMPFVFNCLLAFLCQSIAVQKHHVDTVLKCCQLKLSMKYNQITPSVQNLFSGTHRCYQRY